MDSAAAIDASYRVLMLVLLLSLPAVLTSATIGLVTAIAQAVTQIQDQGVAQALKLIGVLVVLALASKWIATQLYHTADLLFASVGLGGADGR
jgi:type III secretory pathway component EscS